MTSFLRILGLAPTEDERELLKRLRKKEASSMRVVGRGTLVMNAKDARSTKKSKDFMEKMTKLVG